MRRVLIYCLFPLLVIIGLLTISLRWLAEINSDMLYIVSLYKDLFVNHYDVFGWNLHQAPYFFPDMAMFFPLLWATPDIGYAYVLYPILFFLLFLAVLTKIASILNKSHLNGFPCIFSAGLLWVALMQNSNYAFLSLIFFFPSYHGGAILIGFTLIAILLSAMQKGYSWGSAALLFLLSSLTILSDVIIVPQFLLPLVITTLIFYLLGFILLHTFLITFGLIVAAQLVALGLLKVIGMLGIFHIPQVIGYPQDIGFLMNQFLGFIRTMNYYLEATTSLCIIFLGWLVVSVALLVRYWHYLFFPEREQSGECKEVHFVLFLIIFSFFSLLGTIAAPIISGVWVDPPFSIRYMQPLYILPLFVLTIILTTYNNRRAFWLKVAGFSAVIIFGLYQIVPGVKTLKAANLKLSYPKQVQCLDELATNYDLQYGYSDYWNARYTTILSRSGVRVNQLTPDLRIHHWVNNPAWYSHKIGKVGGQYPTYRFILTDRLLKADIEQKFGPPAVQQDCHGMEIYIYNRESDVAFRNFLRIPAIIANGREVPLSLISPEGLRRYTPNGTPWNAPGTVIIPESGEVSFRFDSSVVSEILEIAAGHNDEYTVDFSMNETLLGSLLVPVIPGPGIQARYLSLPKSMLGKPFDRFVVRPLHGDGAYSIGHIFLYEDSH